MQDTMVTLQGWVGNEVTYRETKNGNVATFRVGSTPRIRRGGEWVDGPTSWYTVNCWRALAENVRDSVRKGDPVIVHGRLRVDVWERTDEQLSTTYVVEAFYLGHDLNRGRGVFTKSPPRDRAEVDDGTDPVVKEMIHEQPRDLPQLSSDGLPRREPDQTRVA